MSTPDGFWRCSWFSPKDAFRFAGPEVVPGSTWRNGHDGPARHPKRGG